MQDSKRAVVRLLLAIVAVCVSFSVATYSRAADTPSWLNTTDPFFSFQGSMGPGDIDRVVPTSHSILDGLEPGREWFAWVEVGAQGVVLSSWEAYSQPLDLFSGAIRTDELWNANGPFNLVLYGEVQFDGGIYICVSQTGDSDCNRSGGFGNLNDYTFDLALAPATPINPVPEPEIYAMMAVGLVLLGWVGRGKNAGKVASA